MPTINVFYSEENLFKELEELTTALKEYISKELSGVDIKLAPNEVSIRFIKSEGRGMLSKLELEITAHSFKERVEKQDEICLNVQKFILDQVKSLKDVKVWLILSELGHSWE